MKNRLTKYGYVEKEIDKNIKFVVNIKANNLSTEEEKQKKKI